MCAVHHGTHAWPLVASMFLCQSSGIGHSSGCFFMCLGSRPYLIGRNRLAATHCIQQLHPVASRQVRLVSCALHLVQEDCMVRLCHHVQVICVWCGVVVMSICQVVWCGVAGRCCPCGHGMCSRVRVCAYLLSRLVTTTE